MSNKETEKLVPSDSEPTSLGPELFFAFIGAVGSDLSVVGQSLGRSLLGLHYTPHKIRLSQLLSERDDLRDLIPNADCPEDERIDRFMDSGNHLRRSLGRGDAVALLAIEQIRTERLKALGDADKPVPRAAFILTSLKHPAEIATLRNLYGKNFFAISVVSPYESRINRLASRIAETHNNRDPEAFKEQAKYLIKKDAAESGDEFGQNVSGSFHQADYFIDETSNVDDQTNRLVNMIFGHPYMTPTRDEYGMFMASAAALRSADLSRQVGAIITTESGQIISAGCNEVPAPGGGHVWPDLVEKGHDNRDFRKGHDPNTVMKYEILTEIFDALQKSNLLNERISSQEPRDLVDKLLDGQLGPSFKDLRVANIIEFGRIIHAEMSAITDAARRGIPIEGSWLYTTTFPCHMCARHIISSGIERVIYVEPYPKSMTRELYDFETKVEGDLKEHKVVIFDSFIGLSAKRYLDYFTKVERKDKKGLILN